MSKLHKLLDRQMQQYVPRELLVAPEFQKKMAPFLAAVSACYDDLHDDRRALERSIEVNLHELLRVNDELRIHNLELQSMHKIVLKINSEASLNEVLDMVAQEVGVVSECTFSSIHLFDHKTKKNVIATIWGAGDKGAEWKGRELPLEQAAFGKAFVDGADVFTCDDLETLGPTIVNKEFGIRTYIAIPLRGPLGLKGSITVGHPQPGQCSEQKIKWIQTVAKQLASAVERRELGEMAQQQKVIAVEQSKMWELGRMAGGIAHEINTPLGTLQLLSDHLGEVARSHNVPDLSDGLEKISSTIKRVASIVKGLRAFSREGSKDPFKQSDIGQVIDETLALCGERFRYNQVDIRVERQGELGAKCREIQISQLLLNLLNNAYDAVQKLDERWVIVRAMETADFITISVTDSGFGLPREVREKLGTPFFTTKDIGSGTGLGLSICMGIAKDHGGMLKVDAKSLNTCFVVTLAKDPAIVVPNAA